MYEPKICGITRIRNESLIIQETLDHFAEFCNAGIYVFDDASTDNTVAICKKHKAVKSVIGVKKWNEQGVYADVHQIEAIQRKAIVEEAKKDNPDWLLYLDADERLFWNFEGLTDKYDYVIGRLYDFYITEEDKNRKYTGNLESLRQYCGPEYRDIIFLIKNTGDIVFNKKDCRNPEMSVYKRKLYAGAIKHYGKAISFKEYQKKCDFYIKHSYAYSKLWKNRKNQVIHTESDFCRPLYTWKDVFSKSIRLSLDEYPDDELSRFQIINN